jgi:hypothetical protein
MPATISEAGHPDPPAAAQMSDSHISYSAGPVSEKPLLI